MDFDYVNMLQNVENKTEFKHLPENSELRLIRDSLPRLGIVELDSGEPMIVRVGMLIVDPKTCKEKYNKYPSSDAPRSIFNDASNKIKIVLAGYQGGFGILLQGMSRMCVE